MLYFIKHDTVRSFRYAYKDNSLLRFDFSRCGVCNRTIGSPVYENDTPCLLVEGEGVMPDFVQFSGAGRNMFIVSEKVLQLFESNEVTGVEKPQKLLLLEGDTPNPIGNTTNYYHLPITGKINMDYVKMNLKKKQQCPYCGQFDWNRKRFPLIALDDSSWDNSDLCIVVDRPGEIVCSEKVFHIIKDNELTGFELVLCR